MSRKYWNKSQKTHSYKQMENIQGKYDNEWKVKLRLKKVEEENKKKDMKAKIAESQEYKEYLGLFSFLLFFSFLWAVRTKKKKKKKLQTKKKKKIGKKIKKKRKKKKEDRKAHV
eukprot:TRINITY_DN6325_c1_g1_i2.p1 TRINITY_DN6325_c1_g1~~TRINITY_DN6325_c1_g1_i2.p1  ORF type:complete len:133 (-),score=29.28 TRINITY_DN6325_c1_g1_i2:1-342(-)